MSFKSLVNSGDYLPCRCVSQWRSRCIDALCFRRGKKDAVTSHWQNVGITTRGGFIIPANDLTKRTRRPGMGRVESQSPLSRGRLSCVAFSGEELFSHLYSAVQSTLAPSCGPRIYIRHKPLETSLDGHHRGHRDPPRQWCTTCSRKRETEKLTRPWRTSELFRNY